MNNGLLHMTQTFSNFYTQIFWIGPFLGGIVGAFTFEYTRDCSIELRDPQTHQLVYSLHNKEDVASSISLNTEVPLEQNEIVDEL